MGFALNLIHADALSSLPPVQFLSNTHLVARGLNVLFGPSGSFKSFYMLDAALTIAQLAPVVYVAAEGSSGLHQRVDAWCKYYNRPSGNLHFLCQEINLLLPDQVSKFIEKIGSTFNYKTALIVFDTYARCIPGGDENSAKDTGRAIQQCARIQRELKCAVELTHHTNRAEKGERGSGAMRGAADTMIEMTNGDGSIRVDCSKSKDGEPWPTEHYRFCQVGNSGVLVPDTGSAIADGLTKTQVRVLEFLTLEVFQDCGATSRQIFEALSINPNSGYRILSNLKHSLSVVQDSKGDPYRITSEGRRGLLSKTRQPGNVVDIKDFQQ